MKTTVIYTILALFLVTTTAQARTLQSLAQLSNSLLAQADKPTCKLSSQAISEKSQALQILIDEKSAKLTEGDFKILEGRAETCDKDCTCDIYAYALEKRERPNKTISDKAAKTEMAARLKCAAQVKNVCAQIKAL